VRTVDLLRMVGERRFTPIVKPGQAFSYCNICFDTLALAVERTSKRTYEAFVRDRLLPPAGAVSASFGRPGSATGQARGSGVTDAPHRHRAR
jgi:CubicO group peptidase (beta-lactamase class C family)